MQLAILRQSRPGAVLSALCTSIGLLTLYCQLWSAIEGGVPLTVSLLWASINTASLGLFAIPLWASRQRLLSWIEEAHPASLVAAAGVIFGAFIGSAMLSTLVSGVIWGGGLQLNPVARRLLAVLPFLVAAAIAVTAAIAAFRRKSHPAEPVPLRPPDGDQWIEFPEEPLLRLRIRDMAVIRTARNYCELDIAGRSILVRVTAKQLEGRLAPHGFVRVHRGAIVNVARVRMVQRGRSGRLKLLLDDGSEVAVSKGHRELFAASLAKTRRSRFDGQLAA